MTPRGQKHCTTDPACALYVEPRTWIQRMRFERGRGRSCPICSNYFSDMEILTNDYCSALARAVAAEELAALQGGRAGVAESAPTCQGEAGCPLCYITEATKESADHIEREARP